MPSPESQHIRQWLFQNMKNAPPPTSIQAAREGLKLLASRVVLAPGTKVEPVVAGSVPSEWLTSPGAFPDKIVLCIHSGGYTMGTTKSVHGPGSYISAASRCRVLAINYRLAPEHPFPAAINDSVMAYRWLLEQGYVPKNIVIVGVSSGGGLTLSTLISLRDSGIALPAAAVLLSPWTDLTNSGESVTTRADADPMITPAMNRFHSALYAGSADLRHPLISPLFADLHGLPPLLIQVGSDEIMLDDSTRLAERAGAAGVEVSLDVWEGMWHVWHAFAPQLPEGLQAMEQIGKYIQEKTLGA